MVGIWVPVRSVRGVWVEFFFALFKSRNIVDIRVQLVVFVFNYYNHDLGTFSSLGKFGIWEILGKKKHYLGGTIDNI